MDENDKTDGRTAMERLARELMGAVVSCAPTVWCGEHGIVIHGTRPEQDREHARADIERRIAEARDEDLFKDDYMVRELKRMTGMHLDKDRCTTCGDVDEMVDAVEGWKAKAAELDALSEACRIMPEGMRWPRYEDGEPVRIGDECIIAGETRPITSIEFDASQLRVKCGSLGRIRDYGAPFKRPAPKAFGADGVEVKVGETVWLAPEWRKMANTAADDRCSLYGIDALDALTVESIMRMGLVDTAAVLVEGFAWCPASWLTHEHPDTRSLVIDGMDEETVERIDRLVKDGRWLDD